ncbi:MAG: RNA polymerase sigma factor [Acidobacteria bacterium]|nr:RNA polymerase sigma factor [Acidobacteriota bacterium]
MDPGLLEDLWSTHRRLFNHIALAIVRHADVVEEVVQEAFRRALRSNLDTDKRDEALLYVKRIVTNTSIDYYHRRRKQGVEEELERVDYRTGSPDASPLDQLLHSEREDLNRRRLRQIMEEIQRLPREQRFAIETLVLAESPPSLTALSRSTGIPISTLRSRVILGLDRIRKNLRKKRGRDVESSCSVKR